MDKIEYKYEKDRLERKVEKRQLQEEKTDNEFFIWLYKTLICMIGTAISVCAGEFYRLSFVSVEANPVAYIIVGIFTIILVVLIIKITVLLLKRVRRKYYGN